MQHLTDQGDRKRESGGEGPHSLVCECKALQKRMEHGHTVKSPAHTQTPGLIRTIVSLDCCGFRWERSRNRRPFSVRRGTSSELKAGLSENTAGYDVVRKNNQEKKDILD